MSINLKEEDSSQKNTSENNRANLLKDEDFLKKLEDKSQLQRDSITLDTNLISNKNINCSLSNEWNTANFPKFLVELSSESKKNYPIDNYLNNQAEDNIFYQHPNLINENENNIVILNSLRDLEVDLMNKWFENSEYFEYYLSLYHQELFLNEERKLDNINKLKEKIKTNLEKEIKSISNNQTFKFNLVLIKFLLKELSNITLDNIDELFLNLNNFENYSKFLDEHFEISFLLIKEKKDLLKKINNLIDNIIESNNENKEIKLGKLLLYEYNIVFGLKSLYGILTFIKKIKELQNKNQLTDYIKDLLLSNMKIPYLAKSSNENENSEIKKIEIKNEEKSYIKLSNEEFKFTNSCLSFLSNDLAYLLDDKNALYKLHRLNYNKNKYNIIETNPNFIEDNNTYIFSLKKEFLFGLNVTEFGKSENCIKLLKTEHDSNNTKININMDETSKKIFNESISKPKEVINDIYLNLFSLEENEKNAFLNSYLPITGDINNNFGIINYNNDLFILHPIYKKNTNQDKNVDNQLIYKNKDYFYSENYIYVIDQFEIYLNLNKIKAGDENILNIYYKYSFIIKKPIDSTSLSEEDQNDKKNKINIDNILNNIKTKNKFIIINNYLCFTDTCKNFFDIKNKILCSLEDESNENPIVKDISGESKENLSNSIISQFNNSLIYLTLIKSTINNVQEIKENEYIINTIYDSCNDNIFLKKKTIIKEIKENTKLILKNKSNLIDDNKNDIFREVFQTFDDNEENDSLKEEEKNMNKNKINELSYDFTNYILSYLCNTIIENNNLYEIREYIDYIIKNENIDIYKITKYLKRPFIINVDYPTIKLIEDLINIYLENNKDNSNKENFNVFCLLFILEHHLTYLMTLKINSKFLFGNIKNIDILIDLLKKISSSNKEYNNICYSLLIKILSITEDYPTDKINILFKEILYPIDFLENSGKLLFYIEIFKYANYSKANMKTIVNNESSYKFIFELIEALLVNEKNINLSYISEFFNEFLLFYNNLISYILVNMCGTKFSSFVNGLLNLYINNISEEKIKDKKILKTLLYHLIIQLLNNNKLLPNDFYLQNWSYIYDILFILQNLRNNISEKNNENKDSKNKKDFILDTFNFSSDFPGNKYKEIFFGKLSHDKSFIEEDENVEKEINIIDTNSNENNNLYIQALLIMKTQNQFTKKTNTNNILEIIDVENNETLFNIDNIACNNKVEIIYKKIEKVNIINNTIKIRLYPQSLNYLIKMRVSNYLFYNENIDILVNPLTELMNKILKKFSFYYTNEENEIFNLFHTRLFSKGVSNNILLTKKESKDEEKILTYLKENKNNKEFMELFETNSLNTSKNNIDINDEEEKTITKYNNKNCTTYLDNENIIKCINIFKEKQNIFIKGEIPDKIVNIAFLIILKHENLLTKFIDYTEKIIKKESTFSHDDIYYILFNKCNDLRKTYKEKKDEIIKNEKENEMNNIYDETFNRLYFLFNLNSEGKNKKDKEKKNDNDIINIYIKEHVYNISQIIKNDNFNLSKILEAYRLMQSQAKFREMSLIIINNIIQKFSDKQCKDNIIENYYKNFCFSNNANIIKLPNIYESLNSVSENLVLNITNNFNSLINSILDKLITSENIDTYFDLTIDLNFLLWKIKRRNYPTTNKIFEFFNKSKNPLIDDAKKYFFFYNNKKDKKSNTINQFKEFRIMDKYATAKILSDIFIYYYQESMIIELEKKINSTDKQLDSFKLMKGQSVLLKDTYHNILDSISSIFNSQFSDLLQCFKENEKTNNPNQKIIYNSKLSNLLNEFIKLALSDLDSIFQEEELWKQLYKLLPYSNYQNTCFIFNLLKKFTGSSFEMFNDIFSAEFNNQYTNEKYYDYLFNIMKDNKYKSLFCDYLNYIYIKYKDKETFLNYIEKKIREENQIFLLEMFGYRLQYLNHLCYVRVNTNLNLENRSLVYKPSEKELTHLIKNGYYFDNFKEKSIKTIINEKKLKEQEAILRDIGNEVESDYYSDEDNYEDYIDDDDSDEDDDSDDSRNSDDNAAQQDHFEERNLEELMKKEDIVRDIKILSKKIYGKTPNFLNVNENEIIVEEHYLDVKNSIYSLNDGLIDCILKYLEKQLIIENKFSPKLLLEYVSIIKCIIANSDNIKVKEFVSKNISVLKQIINILIDPKQNFNLYSSELFLLKNKIEISLGCLLKLLPNLDQESPLLLKDSSNEDYLNDKNEKTLTKIYSTFISNSESDVITIYLEPTKKIVIPVINKCDLNELDFMNNDYFWFRKFELEIINKKVYQGLLDKYKVNGKLREGGKYPDVNDKIIIITEDLLKEIGLSDYDYYDTKKSIRKLRKLKMNKEEENPDKKTKNKKNGGKKNEDSLNDLRDEDSEEFEDDIDNDNDNDDSEGEDVNNKEKNKNEDNGKDNEDINEEEEDKNEGKDIKEDEDEDKDKMENKSKDKKEDEEKMESEDKKEDKYKKEDENKDIKEDEDKNEDAKKDKKEDEEKNEEENKDKKENDEIKKKEDNKENEENKDKKEVDEEIKELKEDNKEEKDEDKENNEEKKEDKEKKNMEKDKGNIDDKKEEDKIESIDKDKKDREKNKEKDKDESKNKKNKKKEKNVKQIEPENFKSEKWTEFYDILDYKYQLGNCIFLIDNQFFYKFPKKFICYGLDNSEFSTNNLDDEKLISKIIEETKGVDDKIPDFIFKNLFNNKNKDKENEENKDENKSDENKNDENKEDKNDKQDKENENLNENLGPSFNMSNNLFEMICKQFYIKVKESNEKIIDRNLELPKRFADLYNLSIKLFDFASSFKSFGKNNENNLLNSEEYKKIKYLGIYLIKYYITLLLIKNENYEDLDINDFKFMFYITLYYNNYFGLSEEHNIIKKGIYKYLDRTLKNGKNENKNLVNELVSQLINNNIEIFSLETFFEHIISFNKMIQEDFLLVIIEYLINNFVEQNERDENNKGKKVEYLILNNLFTKLTKYYNENSLEKCIIIYRIIYDTIKQLIEKINLNQQKMLLIHIFNEQKIIKTLLLVMNNSKKKMQRTDFSIYTIEFLLNILNIFLEKNINLNKNEIESMDNIQDLINLCNDYEIINEKLKSKYIINKLIVEDEEWCKLITLKKNLPNLKIPNVISQCSYAFQFIEEKADSYKISTGKDNNIKNYLTSYLDLNNKESKDNKNDNNGKKQKKNNNKDKLHLTLIKNDIRYNTNSNEVLIMHEPQNNIKNICIGEMKNIEDELKKEVIDIKYVFNFTDRGLILLDKNDKFYSIGEWFGNYDDSEQIEIKNRPELDNINAEDKIIYIGDNCILTKTSLYFVKDYIPRNLPDLENLHDGKIARYPLPVLKNGEYFIKAIYNNSLVLLTNKKNLYGILIKGYYQILNNSEISDKYSLIQIKTPETLEIIDYVLNYDCLIYLGYDTKRRTNILYGNLNTEDMHLFSKNAQRNLTKYVFMKELSFLSDKNITDIFLADNKFLAFSKIEGKVYYLDDNQTGVKNLKYFLNLNIHVRDVFQRCNGFFFIADTNKSTKNEIINKDNNNQNLDNKEKNINLNIINNNSDKNILDGKNDNDIIFYRIEGNINFGDKLFFCGSGDISKLIGEEDYIDRIKLKKPKMVNLDEEYIKQNYLKKKNDLTLKLKNILYDSSKFYANFDYYQSFINPKKILEESNYSLKNEKIKLYIIYREQKDTIYFIELISRYEKAIKDDEYEQFLFQITSSNINDLNEKEKELFNNIINTSLNDDKYKYLYIQDLNDIYIEDISDKEIMYRQILKEEIYEFIEFLPQIKKIIFELPKTIKLKDDDYTLIDNINTIKNIYKEKIIIENDIEFKKLFIEKIDDTLLEMKMDITNENIEKFYPEQYKKIKQKVVNLLSSINVDYLLEYQKALPIYLKEREEIKNKIKRNKNENKENIKDQNPKNLIEYMKEKYQFYDRFIKFAEKPEIIETIGNLVSQISKSAENLLNHSAILYNTSLTKILFSNINFLSEKSRNENFTSNLSLLKHSKFMKEIRIDRMLNLKKCNMNLIDKDLEWSLIAQLYKSPLGKEKGISFFKGRAKNLFQVNLEGEHASDAGGPGREIFSSCFEQLTSCNVDLFIPSPNNKSQTGIDRDKYIFNPLGAKNEKYLEIYKFIGKLFGYIISSETYVSLNLSPIVYKQILGKHLEASDIELIDVQSYKSIIKVLSTNNMEQKKKLFGIISFICQLPGGEVVELKEKGNSIYVDENNCEEFLELYLKTMTNQGYLQAKAVQEGLFEVIPEYMLKFLTPSDLEKKICGEEYFDLELLKNITVYEGYKASDITIKYFWQFLEECTLEDKCNYIKFVWGRSRLPKDAKGFGGDPHKITKKTDCIHNDGRKYLPIAHTCFFELELPPYDNYNTLKDKLLYAVRNSVVISDNNEFLDIKI